MAGPSVADRHYWMPGAMMVHLVNTEPILLVYFTFFVYNQIESIYVYILLYNVYSAKIPIVFLPFTKKSAYYPYLIFLIM